MDELVWEGDINGKGRLRELEKPIIQQSHCPQSDSAVSKRYLCPGKHGASGVLDHACSWDGAGEKHDFVPD